MASMMAIMTTILIFLIHVAPSCSLAMDARDYAALKAVREAIKNKEKFLEIQCDLSYYFGPYLCDSFGRVTRIDLTYQGMEGRIAVEIGNLTSLTELYLFGNKLSGSIPSSIGQLTSLKLLSLSNNQLSGSIPSSIGKMTSLQHIFFDHNQLIGSIPASISQLTSLQYLDISNNYFTGPIIQVNGNPLCRLLASNCLFGSSLPKGCDSNNQRSQSACLSFCNATQAGGPCGGSGVCSNSENGTSACACKQGYTDIRIKHNCKCKAACGS